MRPRRASRALNWDVILRWNSAGCEDREGGQWGQACHDGRDGMEVEVGGSQGEAGRRDDEGRRDGKASNAAATGQQRLQAAGRSPPTGEGRREGGASWDGRGGPTWVGRPMAAEFP